MRDRPPLGQQNISFRLLDLEVVQYSPIFFFSPFLISLPLLPTLMIYITYMIFTITVELLYSCVPWYIYLLIERIEGLLLSYHHIRTPILPPLCFLGTLVGRANSQGSGWCQWPLALRGLAAVLPRECIPLGLLFRHTTRHHGGNSYITAVKCITHVG